MSDGTLQAKKDQPKFQNRALVIPVRLVKEPAPGIRIPAHWSLCLARARLCFHRIVDGKLTPAISLALRPSLGEGGLSVGANEARGAPLLGLVRAGGAKRAHRGHHVEEGPGGALH